MSCLNFSVDCYKCISNICQTNDGDNGNSSNIWQANDVNNGNSNKNVKVVTTEPVSSFIYVFQPTSSSTRTQETEPETDIIPMEQLQFVTMH